MVLSPRVPTHRPPGRHVSPRLAPGGEAGRAIARADSGQEREAQVAASAPAARVLGAWQPSPSAAGMLSGGEGTAGEIAQC